METIMVIIIMGIFSAITIPKFFTLASYQNQVYFDDTVSAIRYAQKFAVATGCLVQVTVNAHGYALNRPSEEDQCRNANALFSLPITRPGSQTPYINTEPDLTLSPNTVFTFDALGRASGNINLSVNQSQTITIVKETGFVYGN